VRLEVHRESRESYVVDTRPATVRSDGPGVMRVAVTGTSYAECELAVMQGRAQLVTDRGSVNLLSGERSTASDNELPSRPEPFSVRRADAFESWALVQRDERSASRSTQYLPADVRPYGSSLDRFGTWEQDSSYGYVWYPAVDATWQPYYSGYWSALPGYGWTWVGHDRWAWLTHHYGRWGYARSRWFWIPGRRWGPAWVSWGAAPGYVSWCPLGFDDRPVFAASFSTGTSRGWNVLPRERFGVRGVLADRRVRPGAIGPRAPFVVQNAPPVPLPSEAARRLETSSDYRRGSRPAAIGREPRAVSADPSSRTSRTPSYRLRGSTEPPEAGAAANPTDRGGTSRSPVAAERAGRTPRSTDRVAERPARPTTSSPVTGNGPGDARERPRYPFGDFRRPVDGDSSLPQSADQSPQAQPRDQNGTSRRDPQARRSDGRVGNGSGRSSDGNGARENDVPRPFGRTNETPRSIVVPPPQSLGAPAPSPAGSAVPRSEPRAFGRSPQRDGGGSIPSRGPEAGSGSTPPQGGAAGGNESRGGGDGGRAHAPESRRPPR
jgi:hypothetical protein